MCVREIEDYVKCIVLASDGFWDMIDANETMDYIRSFNQNVRIFGEH